MDYRRHDHDDKEFCSSSNPVFGNGLLIHFIRCVTSLPPTQRLSQNSYRASFIGYSDKEYVTPSPLLLTKIRTISNDKFDNLQRVTALLVHYLYSSCLSWREKLKSYLNYYFHDNGFHSSNATYS